MQVNFRPQAGVPEQRPLLISALLLMLVALLLVWPVFGKMALKLALMVPLAVVAIWAAVRLRCRLPAELYAPVAMLALLTAWFVVQSLLVSDHPLQAFVQLWRHWFRIILMFAAGIAVGLLVARDAPGGRGAGDVVKFLFWCFLAQVVAGLVEWALQARAAGGPTMYEYSVLYQNRFHVSLIANLFAAALFAQLVGKLCDDGRATAIAYAPIAVGIGLLLLLNYVLATRHGWINLVAISLAGIPLLVAGTRATGPRFFRLAIFGSGLALTLGVWQLASNNESRWAGFVETVPIALDIEKHDAWRNFQGTEAPNWPRLKDGKPVEHSNYMRIAWIRASLGMIADAPLGVGYERTAFADAVAKHYGSSERLGASHAHSGVTDLALAGGLPAISLWLALYFLLLRHGWLAFRHNADVPSALLVLFVVSFVVRALVDSTLFDYVDARSMLLLGLTAALVRRRREPAAS